MTSAEKLANLERIGKVHAEPPRRAEIEGLVRSAVNRLEDARNADLSRDSRFDLAYNAAHALALAALRLAGYRSDNRYLVFQLLPVTLDARPETWRLLAKCHDIRNRVEYEGSVDLTDRLVEDLLVAAGDLLESVRRLELPPPAQA